MRYALKHIRILNGHTDMTPVMGKAILIDGETIAAIVEEEDIPDGYAVADMEGAYVLPGLINLHVHLPAGGKPSKKKTDYAKVAKLLRFGVVRLVIRKMCEGYAKQQLLSGVTTIRAVGGVLDLDTRVRDRIAAGKCVGPRVLAANYAISVPGGHMTGSVALPAHSPEEAAQMVRDIAATKPDLIKLMITGGVLDAEVPGEPGILKMPPAYVKAAAAEAHRLGFKVAAHVESTEGMLVALQNGVDTLEHGGKPTDEVVRLFKETGAALIATLSPAIPFAEMDPAITGMSETDLINGKALLANMIACIKTCLEAGIPVGLGTDTGCPYVTHYGTWRELQYLCRYCGVTPAEALHMATAVNASVAGLSEVTGTVEAGKCADLMIVRENPLDDLAALSEPVAVVTRGQMIDHPQTKKYPAVERELDRVFRK